MDSGGGGGSGLLLSDQVLADIDDSSLDQLTERLLGQVVEQLVHIASTEGLQEDMCALDASGLNLLHYTCLFDAVRRSACTTSILKFSVPV